MPGVIGIRYPLQWTILKKDRYIDIQSMIFDDLLAQRISIKMVPQLSKVNSLETTNG